jgi:hypothetical protein
MYGVPFIAGIGLASLMDLMPEFLSLKPSMRFVHWLLTENPFYPAQMVSGLYLGWALGRWLRHRVMVWVWLLPLYPFTAPLPTRSGRS